MDTDKRQIKDSVALLKKHGIIEHDSDIAKALKYSRGAVSELLNPDSGKPMTYPFMKKFNDAYGKHIEEIQATEAKDVKVDSCVADRLKTLEAQMKVFKESIISLIADKKDKHPALISAELDEAVNILKKQ